MKLGWKRCFLQHTLPYIICQTFAYLVPLPSTVTSSPGLTPRTRWAPSCLRASELTPFPVPGMISQVCTWLSASHYLVLNQNTLRQAFPDHTQATSLLRKLPFHHFIAITTMRNGLIYLFTYLFSVFCFLNNVLYERHSVSSFHHCIQCLEHGQVHNQNCQTNK